MELLNICLLKSIVFAGGSDLKLDVAFKPILQGIVGISSAVAALSLAICILRYMVAEDGNSLAAAKKDAITVVIAWVALNSIGTFIFAALTLISGIDV